MDTLNKTLVKKCFQRIYTWIIQNSMFLIKIMLLKMNEKVQFEYSGDVCIHLVLIIYGDLLIKFL